MSYHLGVDLGTTYTAAAVARDGRAEAVTLGTRSVAVPSVVALGSDGQLVIGEPAARRAVTDPRRVAREFKRRIGDPTPLILGGTPIAAELLSARVLAWVVGQVTTTEGAAPASLAVTHPANWGPYKLDLLRQAIRHVGLRADHLVPEPVAAATTYATQRPLAPGAVVAVYDLGGGTFDAALVRATGDGFELVGTPDGIERLGGIDFDHAVLRHVLDTLGIDVDALDPEAPGVASSLAQLRQHCVEAKEALSSEADVDVPVMFPGRHDEVRITRAEFEEMIRPALHETVVAMRRAVDRAGVPLDDVSAVLLVGGSSRIPLVAQLVAAELGRPIAVDARPKDAVPVGAALTAMRTAPAVPAGAPVAAAAGVAAAAAAAAAAPGAPGAPAGGPAGGPLPPGPGNGATGAWAPAGASSGRPAAGDPAAPAGLTGTSGPSTGPGGPGGFPAAPGPARRRSALLAGAAALLVAAGAAGAMALSGGDGDGGDPATTSSSTTAATPSSATTAGGGDPTTTADPLGGLGDLAGGLTGSGDGEPSPPLPGDDWSPEAREAFVAECGPGMVEQTGGIVSDGAATCGCIYDEVQAQGVDFAEFNEQWSAEDLDMASPVRSALESATFSCATSGAGL